MTALYLTRVNPELRAVAIKAVKAALIAAGMENSREAFEAAETAVYTVLSTGEARGLVIEQEGVATAEQVIAAAEAFAEVIGSTGAAEARSIDLEGHEHAVTPESEHKPAAPPSGGQPESREAAITRDFMADPAPDFAPSKAAAETAALLLGMCEGNAQQAFVYARRLASTTGNPELWIEVGHIVGEAFGYKAVAVVV